MIVFSFKANDTVQQKPKHGPHLAPPPRVHFRCSHVGLTQVTPPGPRTPTPSVDANTFSGRDRQTLVQAPESHSTNFTPPSPPPRRRHSGTASCTTCQYDQVTALSHDVKCPCHPTLRFQYLTPGDAFWLVGRFVGLSLVRG